jgi:DNA recombination protein RmuC
MVLEQNDILIFLSGLFFGGLVLWVILKQRHNIELSSLVNESNLKIRNISDKLQSEKNHFEEKIKLLDESKHQLKLEFENISNKLYDQNLKKSSASLNTVLNPLKDQIQTFGNRVNEIYTDETKQRSTLLSEIKYLKELNNQISQDAINLTQALKGENKTQGDWGEMILSKILEQSGLNEGREYSTQSSFTLENGKRARPDVVLHLPQNKDIIIDSKVSLVSYLKYNEAKDNQEKEIALKELMLSIKTHIKDLSSKEYENINEVKTLDFVLMFIPIESAFMLTVSKDNSLFKMAFDNNIMLVSSSTLLITLRTIENIWQYEYQNKNAQLIAKKAADLYDKFAGFVDDIEDIGKSINKSNKSYESAVNKLSSGKGNILTRIEEFRELGVKPKKNLT